MQESTDKRWLGINNIARSQLEIRDYSQKPLLAADFLNPDHPAQINIPGAQLIQRQIHPQHHRGFFGEFARHGDLPFWPNQWSTARMFRDTAKGFHIHPPHIPAGEDPTSWFQKLFASTNPDLTLPPYSKEQWDVMFFVQGIAEMILVDERSGMPRNQLRCLINGDDRPGNNNAAIIIPPGVAHAIRSASSTDLIMVYGTSTTFSPDNEGRIASNIERADLPADWQSYLEQQ